MKSTATDITVVIPVYNRGEMLRACLDSIASQSLGPGRVIVVDDGSTDDTAAIASGHSLRPTVIKAEHRGVCAARNLGLEAVDTPWTMFFDSDDVMTEHHIANAVSGAFDDVDIVGWDVQTCMPDGKVRCLPFEVDDIAWHNIMHGTFATQRYMARTELFRSAGGWNADLNIWVDIELGVRLLALHPRVMKIKERDFGVRVYVSDDSITGKSWTSRLNRYREVLSAIEKNIDPKNRDWLSLKRAILAADVAREDAVKGKSLYHTIVPRPIGVRLAYHYRRLGGRGAARLLRLFFSKSASR